MSYEYANKIHSFDFCSSTLENQAIVEKFDRVFSENKVYLHAVNFSSLSLYDKSL